MEKVETKNEHERKLYKGGEMKFKFQEIRDLKGRIKGMRKYMDILAHQYRKADDGSDEEHHNDFNDNQESVVVPTVVTPVVNTAKEAQRKKNIEMRKFSKNLTQKKLMQAAIASKNDQDYADKVAECFEWRCQKMQKK